LIAKDALGSIRRRRRDASKTQVLSGPGHKKKRRAS
jgi:hypothetical protein